MRDNVTQEKKKEWYIDESIHANPNKLRGS